MKYMLSALWLILDQILLRKFDDNLWTVWRIYLVCSYVVMQPHVKSFLLPQNVQEFLSI